MVTGMDRDFHARESNKSWRNREIKFELKRPDGSSGPFLGAKCRTGFPARYNPGMAENASATEFLKFSRGKLLEQYWPRLRGCVESLTDEQIWWRPNESSNSVGNLVLHLNGNVAQWLVTSFAHKQDARNRPAEFAQKDVVPKTELLMLLGKTMEAAAATLARVTESELAATYQIQGYTVTGLHAIYQVVEHFGLHYGQIVYVTKLLQGKDLGFYKDLAKTGHLPASSGTHSSP